MWCPGIAAAATLGLTGGKLSELGWRGAPLRYVALGWAVPLLGLSLAYALVCVLGKASFPEPRFLARAAQAMGMSDAPLPIILLAQAGIAATVGPINFGGRALGEELGWRGLLVPEACAAFGFVPGALVSGAVWGLWHFPLLIGHASFTEMVNFVVLVIGISVGFAWLRLKSHSIWPSTLWHGTHNAFRDLFLNPLTLSTAAGRWWLDETGYSLALLGGCVAALFIALHRRDARNATAERLKIQRAQTMPRIGSRP
jgi:membrane protease YdiL (CAAX protease family)